MATHEDVKEFNREINSVLATAPPISRAKMAAITKSALKAQSHYKHVVMLVEKFIAKCPAEYKVPGLYIVDSIVRQSKHNAGFKKWRLTKT
jgi:arginine/serine-rich splicing factor 15